MPLRVAKPWQNLLYVVLYLQVESILLPLKWISTDNNRERNPNDNVSLFTAVGGGMATDPRREPKWKTFRMAMRKHFSILPAKQWALPTSVILRPPEMNPDSVPGVFGFSLICDLTRFWPYTTQASSWHSRRNNWFLWGFWTYTLASAISVLYISKFFSVFDWWMH